MSCDLFQKVILLHFILYFYACDVWYKQKYGIWSLCLILNKSPISRLKKSQHKGLERRDFFLQNSGKSRFAQRSLNAAFTKTNLQQQKNGCRNCDANYVTVLGVRDSPKHSLCSASRPPLLTCWLHPINSLQQEAWALLSSHSWGTQLIDDREEFAAFLRTQATWPLTAHTKKGFPLPCESLWWVSYLCL